VKRLPLLVLALLAGCAGSDPEPTPMAAELRQVAILPFFDETGRSSFDGDEFGSILASEVVKAQGIRVIRPAHFKEKFQSVADAVRAARKLGADTVLACAVTDYDPYDPPRIAVHVQVLRTEPRALSTKELDVLLQSGSWKKGPLPMTRESAPHAVTAFEAVYDARDPETRRRIEAYSARPSDITAVQPRWLQFVSLQILKRAYGS
jgi:hypothetical protein